MWSDNLPKSIKAKRRIGKSPKELGITDNDPGCPDIWEDEMGNFIIIGTDVTDSLNLDGTDATIAPVEKAVIIPRSLLIAAKKDIPSQ